MGNRCDWVQSSMSKVYHDEEWGIPEHDDIKLFEMLILEGMQAGLSWDIILKKRESMRENFDQFNPEVIQKYDDAKVASFMNNPNLIRNRLKLKSLAINAKAFCEIVQQYGSFNKYIWKFVDYRPIIHCCKGSSDMPSTSSHATKMSKSLKKNGFKYVGPVTCYSFMQAVGMVDDHAIWCEWHSNNRMSRR